MSDFHKSRGRRDGLQSYCRACSTLQQRRWLQGHRDVRRRYVLSVRQRNVQRKMEYLRGRSCVDCGEADPLVLEFDHRGGKSKAVADLVRSTVSWKRIEQEMAKCDVRCANCHRRKTARERGWLSVEALRSEPERPGEVADIQRIRTRSDSTIQSLPAGDSAVKRSMAR